MSKVYCNECKFHHRHNGWNGTEPIHVCLHDCSKSDNWCYRTVRIPPHILNKNNDCKNFKEIEYGK
jgi:hypothetical protein